MKILTCMNDCGGTLIMVKTVDDFLVTLLTPTK